MSGATTAAGTTFAGVINNGYVSEYFLAYRMNTGFDELFKAWDAAERNGDPTARTRVRGLGRSFDSLRLDAVGTQPDPDDPDVALKAVSVDAQRALNDAVLAAFGWEPQRMTLSLVQGDSVVEVPAACVHTTASGTLLVALDTVFASDPEVLVAGRGDATGRLLEPLMTNGRPVAATLLEAAQVIFTCDDAPTYLLGCAGGAVVLLDRARWGEGIYLGVDLDGALARRDEAKKGELAVIAALLSADSLDPGADAQSALDRMLERAASEAVGVNKELRHGVRRSVELLAQAVVADIRHRQHGAWQQVDPDELTRQCLRYLYRIIVLLFAEARPELAILPVDERYYRTGYSIARLRELALVELDSETSRNATHIQDSLALLFALVDGGHERDNVMGGDAPELTFPGLHAGLFADTACPMLHRARLTDATLQQVLANLCFTRPRAGQPRHSLSYATLGINQLGAVYEGLMAYRGRMADGDYFEVDNDGDPDTGTWLVSADVADEYPDDVFVTEEGPDGQPRRVRYSEGDFIFRLAGRDRQRSASFYTPEVLTEFTVRHALDVYEEEHPDMTPADWLAMTVCEPALGSGAFANEAINQLAGRYLKAAQDASSETIDADRYQLELQKAKAHFAINRTYGVDLNRTAVELAEVSLWLNCMHDGLAAPDFSARLRRGNSLIGCRRATYTPDQVESQPWKHSSSNPAVPPTAQPLADVPFGKPVGIHHFLVPGEGWGSAASAKELKGTRAAPGLAADWAEAVGDWRKRVFRKPTAAQISRLEAIAARVEEAWEQAAKDTATYLDAKQQRVDVWGATDGDLPSDDQPLDSGVRYRDPDGPATRLRLVMDAWCSLWMWAPEHGTDLPSLEEWLDTLELLFGKADESERDTLFGSVELTDDTSESIELFGKATVADVLKHHPWLVSCQEIAGRQAFFHWELDFAPVFSGHNGGFDLQVGNPPWVRPTWDGPASLAEHDPWWGIANLKEVPDSQKRSRRLISLELRGVEDTYVSEYSENVAVNGLLTSAALESVLSGIQTNLYLNFMTRAWSRSGNSGVVGLIHPESHFLDPKAAALRSITYRRLRRHWQFEGANNFFDGVNSPTQSFGINVYGRKGSDIRFVQASYLRSTATLDRSLSHDGFGPKPQLQFPDGGWDTRPHQSRLITVDDEILRGWVGLLDSSDSQPCESKLLRPLTQDDLEILATFARLPKRLGGQPRDWTSGFHETGQREDETIEWRTAIPADLADCVLQGPHVLNGNPFAQQPRENCRSKADWDPLDLEELTAEFVPRTNYQRLVDQVEYQRRQTAWGGKPYTSRYREVHREYVGGGSVRTLQAAVLPPGPAVVGSLVTIALPSDWETVRLAALYSSIPYDYVVKIAGFSHIKQYVTDSLPVLTLSPVLDEPLVHRMLRLTCVTGAYSALWRELFRESFMSDSLCIDVASGRMSEATAEWNPGLPLRVDRDRWAALCEIDSIVAVAMGITEEQFAQIYLSQFPVLRRYEYVTVFDANGRQISGIHHNHGFKQAEWEAEYRSTPVPRGQRRMGMWDRVQAYLAGDTDVDLGPFEPPFTPADRELAMRTAYRAFAKRLERK